MASGDVITSSNLPKDNLTYVKHIILVMSGKGGVGKSTIASHIAVTLQKSFNQRVGLLDIDLCGPSIARLFGVENSSVVQSSHGWAPIKVASSEPERADILLMSIAFLIPDREQAVIWRGPKKQSMIKTFVDDVHWADEQNPLDYLIIDTPPGTSDEHISIVEFLTKARNNSANANNTIGAILVTTPQMLAVNDVRRQITFCKKTGLKVLGLVENMSGYVCPHCSECSAIFSAGGGEQLAQLSGVTFLGCVPIKASIAEACDSGHVAMLNTLPDAVLHITKQIIDIQV